MIPFNKPFIIGKELDYIRDAVETGKISGDGKYTLLCQKFLEQKYGFQKVLLTTSCTDALEMSALLMNIKEGDEVIVPSFAFVSTANAFALRGAKIVFCDIDPLTLNIEAKEIEKLITNKTKAIVVLHYAGVACDMDGIMDIIKKNNLFLVEDAALALHSFYKGKPLGSFGHFATFSFHETKNIIAGEGGALAINDPSFIERAEIIREKGTNRSKFFRGETQKYTWVDIGSSFLPSDIIAAFLYAQLENIENIINKRISIGDRYKKVFHEKGIEAKCKLPYIPNYATQNGQMFYMICKNESERDRLINYLYQKNIKAVFHYLPLHSSPYYSEKHDHRVLPVSDQMSNSLLRLPLYYNLSIEEQDQVIQAVDSFFKKIII